MGVYSQLIEIDAGEGVWAVTFSANGEYLVSGGDGGIRVWRVSDGERIATVRTDQSVWCVAVSKDGKYIAAGTSSNKFLVLDTANYEQVTFAHETTAKVKIWEVDFALDSTRLVSADGKKCTATIWDIARHQKLYTLDHVDSYVKAAKYSPRGDRVATATEEFIRVWDSDDGRLLVNFIIQTDPGGGLYWFNNHLCVATKDSKIKHVDVSTASIVLEWSVPTSESRVALPQHGKFVAYSTKDNITFWSTSTHTQLCLIPRSSQRRSIAFSPDDQLFAILEQERKIVIKGLSFITEPDITIENAALDAWKHGQLTNAEGLLTTAIPASQDTAHCLLASRALVRARMEQWDTALVDAENSIELRPSVIGYIAKFVALVGKGEILAGCRVCDIAFQLHSNHVALLLLIKAIVLFMAGEHSDASSRVDDLIPAAYFDSTFLTVQAYMCLLRGNLHVGSGNYGRALQSFEDARVKLRNRTHAPPLIISLISGWIFDDLAVAIEKGSCEALFAAGRIKEAGESVLRIVNHEDNMTCFTKAWAADIMKRCLSTLETDKDSSRDAVRPSSVRVSEETSHVLLREWAKLMLTTDSWKHVLTITTGFVLSRFTIYQVLCEHLEMAGHITEAVMCFHQMHSELQEIDSEQACWKRGFKSRCCEKLENIGDNAMSARQHDEAISQYTAALSLEPVTPLNLLVKRSKAHIANGIWEEALNDADKVIELDPSSPWGYERKHAALHGIRRYDDATNAFETMLSKMSRSSDPGIQELSRHYVSRQQIKEAVRSTIKDTIRDSPPVLINTTSGRLCDKSQQVTAFESSPAFTKLVSSMTTQIDNSSIDEEVEEFYRYAMFSHRWEEDEPLFEKVVKIVVYDLEMSPTHEKLQTFCKLVRKMGFNWAWSDTCCINKADNVVLQEALVSMFKWYEGSAMTIIFLRGVPRLALRGALTRSMWNMRAWTLQEYHASKVVQFYTEDWTPYLDLAIHNHKESPEIIAEMEDATGISAQALMALRPGIDDIREKLRLASTRQTTEVEDVAYSLLGIFSSSLHTVYGEGDRALGRLLAQLLASSGDTSILAWTGKSNTLNSCLPDSITVFREPPTTHIPQAIRDVEIGPTTTGLRSLASATRLYDLVNGLPVPSFSERRMKLPCLAFKLGQLAVSQNRSERVFRSKTNGLGIVEIQTQADISHLDTLYLIHPWIDFLLDRQPVGGMIVSDDQSSMLQESSALPNPARSTTLQIPAVWPLTHLVQRGRSTDAASLRSPSTMSPEEKQTRVLQFMARLRCQFGALLFTPVRRNVDEYRRVATESAINVRVEEVTPAILERLIQNVRVFDVL